MNWELMFILIIFGCITGSLISFYFICKSITWKGKEDIKKKEID